MSRLVDKEKGYKERRRIRVRFRGIRRGRRDVGLDKKVEGIM